MKELVELIKDFSHLSFPFNCFGCNRVLDANERSVCHECIEHFPLTQYWEYEDNEVAKIFWGRLSLEMACSYMFFNKDGLAQKLMYALKYEGKVEVGKILGNLFATQLNDTSFADVDVVVPVPLHHSKKKKRGYNQCDFIAAGIANIFECGYSTNAVERIRANETQTKKGRYERWINVKELFSVAKPQALADKHVLVVDDVVTTGATLEACAGAILDVPNTKVSIATIACPSPF